jgi:hypothetical protein
VSNLATFFPQLDAVSQIREPVFRVEVNGQWRSGLRPVQYEQKAGDVPRVLLALDVGQAVCGGPRWLPESALEAIQPNDLVTVDLVRGSALLWRGLDSVRLFEGAIDGPAFAYSSTAEEAQFRAVDRSQALLAQAVGGQYVLGSGSPPVWLSGLDLTFNPDGRPNMSAQDVASSGGRARRVFSAVGDTGAELWTAASAANYLVSFYAAASWLALPSAGELTRLFGDRVLENVRVEGQTVLKALEHLSRRIGLRVTVALSPRPDGGLTRTLIFVGRGLGRQISLYHQMPGETFTLARTAMEKAEVEITWSEALARLELAGDVRLYESTFDLVPGWLATLEGQPREAYRRSDNSGLAANADVFRKWVLNEAGDYSAAPYSRGPAHDFLALFAQDDGLQRRRRLLPTVSTDEFGESHGVVVEISYDSGTTFRRYSGAVRVLRDECGVYLSSDELPAELFYAADRGWLRVRATAAVESDDRLRVTVERPGLEPDQRGRRLVLDVSSDYRWRKVDSGSLFHGGPSAEVDDTARLSSLAADLWEAQRRAPTPSHIGLPFFSVSYRVGDTVDAIRYRWAWLKRTSGGIETDPLVDVVRQTFGPEGWRTELVLE